MDNIILFPNPERDIDFLVSGRMSKILDELNASYIVCTEPERLRDNLPGAQLVISFGGDGTILQALRACAESEVPVLGVNMGSKGFMAELELSELDLIKKAIAGDYSLDLRMMLNVDVLRNGEKVFSDFAVNDVVIGGMAKTISISVNSDKNRITSFDGDGLVVATPTGSTAYSMAAGGPIMEPDADAIIVTPICPHVLMAKSFVLASVRYVTAVVGKLGTKSAYLSVDGGPLFNLMEDDAVVVKKSDITARFLRISSSSFYDKVSSKLGEKR